MFSAKTVRSYIDHDLDGNYKDVIFLTSRSSNNAYKPSSFFPFFSISNDLEKWKVKFCLLKRVIEAILFRLLILDLQNEIRNTPERHRSDVDGISKIWL